MLTVPVRSLFPLVLAGLLAGPAQAAAVRFDSPDPASNAATRAAWLAAAGVGAPAYLVDFETGFSDEQNLNGQVLAGGLVISSTDGLVRVEQGPGALGGSNPVGGFAIELADYDYSVTLDFSSNPVDYVAFLEIDNGGFAAENSFLTLVGGATQALVSDSTGGDGDSAEFLGFYRNDLPRILSVTLVGQGTEGWGLDNIEFGQVAVVPLPPAGGLLLGALAALAGLRRPPAAA